MRNHLSWILSVTLVLLAGAAGCAGVQGAPTTAITDTPRDPRQSPEDGGEPEAMWPAKTYYRKVVVDGQPIFYREAGDANAPTLVLLHGYPSSSHTYRELIPLLSVRYHVVAPDNLGSGYSAHPSPDETRYTFDRLARYIAGFIEAIGLEHYFLYMQDFGAPVGFRVAIARPERLCGIIVQNGNAYLDGLVEARRAFFRSARDDTSPEQVQQLREFVSDDAIRNKQYLRDVPGQKRVRMSPDSWTHDIAMLQQPQDRDIQVQLFQDYQNNIDAYPAWQAFLRTHQPPALIVWGEHDPAFVAAGARAYQRDLPSAQVHLLDAGHFAVEEKPVEIAQHVTRFLQDTTCPRTTSLDSRP